MEPLKLWLYENYFSASSFKERRVVWKEVPQGESENFANNMAKLQEIGEDIANNVTNSKRNIAEKFTEEYEKKLAAEREKTMEKANEQKRKRDAKKGPKAPKREDDNQVAEAAEAAARGGEGGPNPAEAAEAEARGGEGGPDKTDRGEAADEEKQEKAKKAPRSTDTGLNTQSPENPDRPDNIPEGYTLNEFFGLYTPGPGIDIAGKSYEVFDKKGKKVEGLEINTSQGLPTAKDGYYLIAKPGNWHAEKLKDASVNKSKTLSPAELEKLVKPDTVRLSLNLTTLTQDQAEIIANKGQKIIGLELNGLTNLTPEAAEPLQSLNKISILQLNGLTNLTPEVAKILSQMKIETLYLNGLTTLTPAAAEHLKKSNINLLSFQSPSVLNSESIQKLKEKQELLLGFRDSSGLKKAQAKDLANTANVIVFDKLQTLSPEIATELANGEKLISLELPEVTTLTEETARALANGNIKLLNLNGYKELTAEIAQTLAHGQISLLSLGKEVQIGVAAAQKLANSNIKYLSLNSSTKVTRAVFDILKNGSFTELRNLSENQIIDSTTKVPTPEPPPIAEDSPDEDAPAEDAPAAAIETPADPEDLPEPPTKNKTATIQKPSEKPKPTFELTPQQASIDLIHETIRVTENSEFADTLNHHEENWNNLFDRFTYRELYKNRLEKHFGISKNEASSTLLKAFQIGINDQIEFEDLLASTNTAYKDLDADQYATKMNDLKAASTETYQQYIDKKVAKHLESSEDEQPAAYQKMVKAYPWAKFKVDKQAAKAELDQMQTLFNAGHDILVHLKKEDALRQTAETKFESKEEKNQQLLDKIDTEIEGFEWMSTPQHEFPDAQGINVGITQEALEDFRLVALGTKVDFEKAVLTISRGYTIKELITEGKVAKTAKGDIIITSLPNNFNTRNYTAVELATGANRETLGTAPEAGQVDAPSLEESHKAEVEKLRKTLSTDVSVARNQILKKLLAADKRAKADIVETVWDDLADKNSEVTLRGDEKHELVDQVALQTSPEAMATNLFDRAEVKGYKLFTIDQNGNKKINKHAYRAYFNHLMEQGEEVRLRQKFPNQPDINVGEITSPPMAEYIKADQSPFDLSDAQIDALRLGYAHELIVEKNQQDLEVIDKETDPQTKAIHEALIAQGYPKDKPLPTREALVGAIAALFEGKDLKAIGAGINVPLGEGFGLHIGADTARGPQAGINIGGTVYKGDYTEAQAGGALNLNLGRSIFRNKAPRLEVAPAAQVLMETTEQWDTGLFATTVLGIDLDNLKDSGLNVAAGFVAKFNQDRAREKAFTRLQNAEGFHQIEAETNPTKRLELIKNHPQFAQFNVQGKELSDADQLAIYEEWANQIAAQADKEATPDCPITGVYAGVALGLPPTILLGFEIRIGDKTYFRPTREERERVAQQLDQKQLEKQLKALDFQSAQGKTIETFESGSFFIDQTGKLAIREGEKTSTNTKAESLQKISDSLTAQNLGLSSTEIEIGGKKIRALELKINNIDKRNLTLQVDPNAKDIQVRVDQDNGRIYLFGNLENLVLDRSTFRYQRREQKGGANVFDVISITNNAENFDPNAINQESALTFEKRLVDDKATAWTPINGVNYKQVTNFGPFNANEQNLPETKTFFDDILDQNWSDWTEIQALAETLQARKTPEQARENWGNQIPELFQELKADLEKGEPNIGDYQAIVERINSQLDNNPMNSTEASQLLTQFQDLYFSDILAKAKNNKDTLLKTFEKNNNWIVEKVLIPEFERAIARLGIQADARELAMELKTAAQEKFVKLLNGYNPDGKTLEEFLKEKRTKETRPHLLFKSGTAIRKTGEKQQGLLSGQMLSDLETLGGLYLPEEDSDLEKVIIEVMLPRPTAVTAEDLATPTAVKLAAFEGMGALLGLDTYRQVVAYYNNPTPENLNQNKNALEKFINLVGAIIDGQNSKIKVDRGALYGTYYKCGNLSLAATENFTYTKEAQDNRGVGVIGRENSVYEDHETGRDIANLFLGVGWKPKEDQPKSETTPKNPANRPKPPAPKNPSAIPDNGPEVPPIDRPSIGAI